jgi:hypothetical protein
VHSTHETPTSDVDIHHSSTCWNHQMNQLLFMTTQLDYFLAILSPSWPSLDRPSIIKVIAKIYTKSTSNLCK